MPVRLAAPARPAASVEALHEHVRRLSYDDAFGMLTRPALIQHARRLPPDAYFVLFLDLSHMRLLNARLGYEEVNRRVRRTFTPAHRRTDLVGRWYSGDEILIVLPHDPTALSGLVVRLVRHARANGLSFVYAFSAWPHPEADFDETVSRLTRLVLARKEVIQAGQNP